MADLSQLTAIVACANHGVMGRDGGMPWHLRSDLQRFKHLTMGHAIIMGRKTYESIGRILPGRTSIVLSRAPSFRLEGAIVVESLIKALESVPEGKIPFVIGGAEIFRLAIPACQRVYRTRILAEIEGDTFFDCFDESDWRMIHEEAIPADANNDYPSLFQEWIRGK